MRGILLTRKSIQHRQSLQHDSEHCSCAAPRAVNFGLRAPCARTFSPTFTGNSPTLAESEPHLRSAPSRSGTETLAPLRGYPSSADTNTSLHDRFAIIGKAVFFARTFPRGVRKRATNGSDKAVPKARSTDRASGRSGAWGLPQQAHRECQKDIPMTCLPVLKMKLLWNTRTILF